MAKNKAPSSDDLHKNPPRTRAPARRREPCICRRQIRKAEPQGIIGAEPLGIESGAKNLPRLQMSQKFRPRHPTEPKFLRHLEIGFAHIEEAANKLNSFVSANVAQIKRLQVVNFVVFCVVLANFLKNPCHNIILKAPDHTRSRPRDGNAAACAQ